jgi:sirohydrochlorin ferrochelatase
MRHPRLSAAAETAAGVTPAGAGQALPRALPPLLAVAHGSTDPRAAATIAALMRLAGQLADRSGLPALDARTAYLGHSPPSVSQVLGALAAPGPGGPGLAARERRVVVLPLLLTAAYHSEVDLPALLAEAAGAHPGLSLRYGDPLGPHPLLLRALDRRLAEHGAPAARATTNPGITQPAGPVPDGRRSSHAGLLPGPPSGLLPGAQAGPLPGAQAGLLPGMPAGPLPGAQAGPPPGVPAGPPPGSPGDIAVVLASAGSRHPAANAAVAGIAARWQAARGWRAVVPAYAAAGSPTPAEAVSALRRGGAPAVMVATYLLAPGRFADQVAESSLAAGAAAVSGALGAAPEVARLVLLRYAAAIARPGRMAGARQGISASR